MSEVAPSQEQRIQEKVSPKSVSDAFHGFQRKVKEGFPSQEQELRSYAGMLETTTKFFQQPPSEIHHARALVNTLFTGHKETALAPIDFFLTVGERLQRTKLSEKDTYRYIGDSSQEELFAARTALRAEEEARQNLERLSSTAPESLPEVAVGTAAERLRTLKQTALTALEHDPLMAEVLAKTTQYTEMLASLDSVTDDALLQEKLASYAAFVSADTVEDLTLHLIIGDTPYVHNKVHELSVAANDPDFTWHQLTRQEAFPSDLYHSFDGLTVMAELAELAHALDGSSKETKAAYFLPYLERGMNATLLEEMAEDRFALPDDFLIQQVETFLDFSQDYEEETESTPHKKHGKTKKLVASALATAVLAVPIVSAQIMIDSQQHKEQTAAGKVVPPVKLKPLPESRPSNPDQKTSSKRQERYRPENTSPEKLLDGQKNVLWNLEGKDLNGFYRNIATAKFDATTTEWDLQKRVIENQIPNQTTAADITLSGTRVLANNMLELPTRSDYALARDSLHISGDIDSYSLFQTVDGSYLVEFDQSAVGEKIEVQYGLGKIDHSVIPQPSAAEVQEMLQPGITIEQMPEGSLKTFMEEVRSSGASPAQKAKSIEEYVKKNFVYSLDGSISDEYNQYIQSDYFKRIYEIQRGDCDVVNTAFIMLLRAQGIPARLVLGDAHTGGFINKNPHKITSAEGHGWAEAYVDGGFMQLDATPTTMDEYTKKALEGKVDERLEFFDMKHAFDFASLEQILTDEDFIGKLLAITGINAGMLAGSMLMRRRNNKAVEKLYKTLNTRTMAYVGSDASERSRRELMETEWRKLSRLSDEPMFNPFVAIAPGGLVRLIKSGFKTNAIKKVPYNKSLPEVSTATQPTVTEYFTKALGYDFTEAEVSTFIRDEAYFESMRTLQFGMHSVIDTLAGKANIYDRNFLIDYLDRTLKGLPKPQTREEWEEIKLKQREALYQTCVASLQPTGWKARFRMKTEPSFTKDIVDEPIEELLRLQLMKWKIQEEYQKIAR